MGDTYIWTLDMSGEDLGSDIPIEIFEGRNKFTKAGLFSGPLRRREIGPFSADDNICFLFSLDGIAQTGKNKFRLSHYAASALFRHFEQRRETCAYCRLQDKKLHHIESFIRQSDGLTGKPPLTYDGKNKALLYGLDSEKNAVGAAKNAGLVTMPCPHLYLDSEEKHIRGFLTFLYGDAEIQANSALEEIAASSSMFLRNLQYERDVLRQLRLIGGKQSFRNEIIFKKNAFFSKTLPLLCKTDVIPYWGSQKKKISKGTVACSISYNMDWFAISGSVADEADEYDLSALLRTSRGKSYVELKDSIFFLPEELKKVSRFAGEDGQIRVPAKNMWEVNRVAAKYQIDPAEYLGRFLDFTSYTFTLPHEWETTLRPYQKTGVIWALNLYRNGFSGCLADDMGLGKTIQAIAVLCCLEKRTSLPELVVVPKIVLHNWANELRRFAPDREFVMAYGEYDYGGIEEKNVIYITTYDTLIHHSEDFSKIKFDAVVLDETQNIKNYRTKRYQAIKKICSNFTLALSGTPIENNIEELWSLFDLLNPGLLGNHGAFMREYGPAVPDKGQLGRLKKIIAPFLLRRTKETELNDLPPKEKRYIYCEMAKPQRALYNRLLSDAQNEIGKKPGRYQIKDNATALNALLNLREVCSDPSLLPPGLRSAIPCDSCKFELFQEYAERIVSGPGKVIVYSLSPRVLKKMESWCRRRGWATFYIDGRTNRRQEIVESFEQSERGVFLISLKAGGVGLNLTSCQYVIIYDPWWNSAAEQQAADRVYRIGQDKPVFIYHFLVKDTIEEKIYELQRKKTELASGVLEGADLVAQLSMEEIYELLL